MAQSKQRAPLSRLPLITLTVRFCSTSDIANASAIVTRLLKEAAILDDEHTLTRVVGLVVWYAGALRRGDHFRGVVTFCDDVIPIIPYGRFEDKLGMIKHEYARSLRMLGEHRRAKEVIEAVIDQAATSEIRQSLFVNLALCHESLHEIEEARAAAKSAVEIDRHSPHRLQARSLLIDMATDDPRRREKLEAFETLCRKSDATVVANNIALIRARAARKTPGLVREILLPVVSSRNKDDYYNRTRAAIELAELALDSGGELDNAEQAYLVGAYHYIFNESLPGLFDRCHDALWRTFSQKEDTSNLLTLFRHSSLYWRLRDQEPAERKYLGKLSAIIGNSISKRLANLSREAAYYLVRANWRSAVLAAPEKPES